MEKTFGFGNSPPTTQQNTGLAVSMGFWNYLFMTKTDDHRADSIRDTQTSLGEPAKGIKTADLVSPFFEHGLTVLAFLGGGYWIMTAYDESIIGFIGIIMMLWGGFKGFILLAIYGFALFALLFRRDWFAHVAERNHILKIEARAEQDARDGHLQQAENRLHGLLGAYPDNMHLRRRLATRLIDREALITAGKFLALHPAPTKPELEAIHQFCKSNGHDPFQIMRKAMKGIRGPDLPTASRKKLHDLHRAITRETDKDAWQWRAVDRYLNNTLLRPRWRDFLDEYRNAMIELAIAIAVVLALWVLR